MWQYLFQNHILKRGLNYFLENRVQDINFTDDTITAVVYGTQAYQVEVIKNNEDIESLECDCPYAESGNHCKHMAAVLFFLDDNEDLTIGGLDASNVYELVKATDIKKVQVFLTDILESNYRLLQLFKEQLHQDTLPESMIYYKRKVDNAFQMHEDSYDFISYRDTWELSSKLTDILDNEIQTMIDNEQYEKAFELSYYIVDSLLNKSWNTSSVEIESVIMQALDVWETILMVCDVELKQGMIEILISDLSQTKMNDAEYWFETFVIDHFEEEEFLVEKLNYFDYKIEECKKDQRPPYFRYRLNQYIINRLEIMEAMKFKDHEIDDYCESNLEISMIRKLYAEICVKRQDFSRALELLREGKEVDKQYRGLVFDYSKRLKELYKITNQNQQYLDELWELVLDGYMVDLGLFEELKSNYPIEIWLDKRELIFNKLSSSRDVDKLFVFEQIYDRLILFVMNSEGLYKLFEHEAILKDKYPELLLEKYEAELNEQLRYASGRSNYREAVSVLRRMIHYPEGSKTVSKIVEGWRIKYKNRPALMDELSRL